MSYDYAFVSCVKLKRDTPCPAKNMYISPLFRKAYSYASARVSEDRIYILSAKYGLIPSSQIIEPYEKTISHARKLEQKRWNANILILAGGGYRKYIERVLPNISCPVRGLTIGQMLKYYNSTNKQK